MGGKSQVSVVAWGLLAQLVACADGGPPSPFSRPSMRNAPNIAADGDKPRANNHAPADDSDAGEPGSDRDAEAP
jgi:hypothetical protein